MSEYRSRIPEHEHQTTPVQVTAFCAAGLASFVTFCLLINLLITAVYWEPDLGLHNLRLRALEQNGAAIDTIIMGSSHVAFALDPLQFDAEVARLGGSTSSFRFDMRSMTTGWSRKILQDIQRTKLPNLQRVFIEPRLYPVDDLDIRTAWKNAATKRTRYVSGVADSLDAARLLWSSAVDVRRKVVDSLQLGHNFSLNAVNLGILPDILVRQPADSAAIRAQWLARGGSDPVEGSIVANMALAPTAEEVGYRKLSSTESAYLTELINLVKAMGAEPVFIFVPGRDDPGLRKAISQDLARNHPTIRTIGDQDFTQASPPYNDSGLWWDVDHLNAAGARIFTTDLARQWVTAQYEDSN